MHDHFPNMAGSPNTVGSLILFETLEKTRQTRDREYYIAKPCAHGKHAKFNATSDFAFVYTIYIYCVCYLCGLQISLIKNSVWEVFAYIQRR